MNNYAAPVKIRLYWEDTNGYQERITTVKSYEWRSLRNSLKRLNKGNSIKLRNDASLTNYDSRNGWFDFCVADFELDNECDVIFEFSDVIDDWWKAGMRCDYVEIRPLDWDTH